MTEVASERTVIRAAGFDDPNTGVIVAAGDPLPAGAAGLIQNTPNKADAAANYDDVDAADRAGAGARPATTVIQQGEGPDPAVLERVEANRNAWEEQSRQLGEAAASPADPAKVKTSTPADDTTPAEAKPPADMTVTELDAKYGSADGYPKSANKAEKVAFAKSQAA